MAWYKTVTWDDAPHLDEKAKQTILSAYPQHERDTRSKGVPLLGSGSVFPVPDEEIMVPPFEIPKHFYQLVGIDFGIDHPAAGVWIAWDKDADTIYVTDCYKRANKTPVYHVAEIQKHGKWIPVAWPHDGVNRDKGSEQSKPLWKAYRSHGAKMLPKSASYEDGKHGPQPIEPVVIEIIERMETGRFKVFSTLHKWFEEKRMYHRKKGQIVDSHDDIMAATRYAVMMKRKAAVNMHSTIKTHKYTKPILGGRR
jgi:hypothetical protein